jgi:hypothetical protein
MTNDIYDTEMEFIFQLTRHVPDEIPWSTISSLQPQQLYGLQVTFAGWGITNNGSIAQHLLLGNLIVLTRNECTGRIKALANDMVPVDKRMICTTATPYILMQQVSNVFEFSLYF